jgi:hypothetical protein
MIEFRVRRLARTDACAVCDRRAKILGTRTFS